MHYRCAQRIKKEAAEDNGETRKHQADNGPVSDHDRQRFDRLDDRLVEAAVVFGFKITLR